MHRAAEVDAFDVFLEAVVGNDADAELLFGGMQAQEGEAEEQGERLGEEGDCEAGEETWNGDVLLARELLLFFCFSCFLPRSWVF